MLNGLFGVVFYLFRLTWLCLVRATFLMWSAGMWGTANCPAIRQVIAESHPAVPLSLALASVLIVFRFFTWLMQIGRGRQYKSEQPQPKRSSLLYHKVGW